MPPQRPDGFAGRPAQPGRWIGAVRKLRLAGGKPGFGERASCPRESLQVPTLKLRDGDSVTRGMDEPSVPEVDPRVVDLRRLGARSMRPEEEDVRRLELRERDPFRLRDLAAHLVRRPAPDDLSEIPFVG